TRKKNCELENVQDTATLTTDLLSQYPLLNTIKFSISVEKKIVRTNTLLNNNNTVAILPPFSGG
ncbi:MAG: MoaD/ThiS family protein, partial [Bacteroidia bacterium]|nr:MoaD/ThiS family protein [Bacteroidia bacterium]